jgi:hypothetical protein
MMEKLLKDHAAAKALMKRAWAMSKKETLLGKHDIEYMAHKAKMEYIEELMEYLKKGVK